TLSHLWNVELGKPYVICINSREIERSNDVTEGMGYGRKQMPLYRKVTGKQKCITDRILSSF
ncbi:hypothetical protein CN686_29220, partial [Bacillus pseudomycoides]